MISEINNTTTAIIKILNKEYNETKQELIELSKRLGYEDYREIEVFEKYLSNHNIVELNQEFTTIKELKLEPGKYIIFGNKEDWYHMVCLIDNTFYDKNEKYNIINIDHHHDLGYGNNAQKGYELNCANWVKHMMDNNQCSSYMWFRNQDSELNGGVDQTDVTSLCTDILLTMDTNLDGLATPDLLCIVTSPQWVPPKFLYLLDCWLTMCESFYGHEFELH